MDIMKLVEDLNEGLKSSGKKSLSDAVYRDVPIIRTASSLPPRVDTEPPEYRKMRSVGNMLSCTNATDSMIFYEQAVMMADFTDDFPYRGGFMSFYPTYRTMSNRQLRGYFSWRTRVRRGDVRRTDLSFAYVYLFELLHLIGCRDAEEAYGRLCAFGEAYAAIEPKIEGTIRLWKRDFIIYYGLGLEKLNGSADQYYDARLTRIMRCADADDDELFDALVSMASFQPANSRFYKEHTADYRRAVCRVYRALSASYEDRSVFVEEVFGSLHALPCTMFASAVFYDRRRDEDRVYEISPFFRYECRDGKWTCYRFQQPAGKNTALGAFLRNVDCLMRETSGFPHKTKRAEGTALFWEVAEREISAFYKEKQAAKRPKITIDLAALDGIRAAADETRDRLMTEEERWTEPPAEPPAAAPLPTAPGSDDETTEASTREGLTATERAFLETLLSGGDPAPLLKGTGVPPSVMAERVNEKCYDLVLDNVIDFDGDTPVIAEYYLEEVRGLLQL